MRGNGWFSLMRCLPLAGGGSVHYSRLRLRDAKARPRQSQSAYHSSENRLFFSPYADRGLSILSSVTHSSRGGRCAKGCEDFDEPAVTISVLGRGGAQAGLNQITAGKIGDQDCAAMGMAGTPHPPFDLRALGGRSFARTGDKPAPNLPQVVGAKTEILERETRLELATSTLARLRSTN